MSILSLGTHSRQSISGFGSLMDFNLNVFHLDVYQLRRRQKMPFFGLTAVLVFLNNRSSKLPWNWMTLRL